MNCPICRQPNQSDAPFCVECGDSLVLGNEAAGGAAGGGAPAAIAHQFTPLPDIPDETFAFAFTLRRHRFGISLALAGLLIAMLLNSMAQRSEVQATQYRQGLAAAQQQQWHHALTLLSPLAAQDYDQASALYRKAAAEAATWDHYHQLAASAEDAGATTQAAYYYNRASQLEPGYGDSAAKLSALHDQVGQIVYRQPAGLYLAAADGEPGALLPGSGNSAELLATSVDGSLICYVFNSGSGAVQMRNLVVGDISRQFYTEQTFLFDHPIPPLMLDAAFVNHGAGLLFVVGGTLGEIAPAPLDLYYLDLAGNTGLSEIGLAHLVARPNPGDALIYFVPSTDARAIALYDTRAELAASVTEGSGAIASLAVSPAVIGPNQNDAANLYYAVTTSGTAAFYSLPLPDGAAQLLLSEPLSAPAQVRISASPATPQALATIVGSSKVWQLNVANATLLGAKWGNTIGATRAVQYSPDGSRILVTSLLRAPSADRSPYAILDSQGTLLNSGYYNAPASQIGWLDDSRHFYVYVAEQHGPAADPGPCPPLTQLCSQGQVAIIDSDRGTNRTFSVAPHPASSPATLFSLLPDGKTFIYIAADGAYVSALDSQSPAVALPGATGVWALPGK